MQIQSEQPRTIEITVILAIITILSSNLSIAPTIKSDTQIKMKFLMIMMRN